MTIFTCFLLCNVSPDLYSPGSWRWCGVIPCRETNYPRVKYPNIQSCGKQYFVPVYIRIYFPTLNQHHGRRDFNNFDPNTLATPLATQAWPHRPAHPGLHCRPPRPAHPGLVFRPPRPSHPGFVCWPPRPSHPGFVCWPPRPSHPGFVCWPPRPSHPVKPNPR